MAVFPLVKRIRARLGMTTARDCFFQRFYERTEDRKAQFDIGYKLIPYTRPECTGKESTGFFDADMFHDFFVPRQCLARLACTCLQSISLLAFSIMEVLKVIFLFFFI